MYNVYSISSDDFSVATPDETTGKETEFSLVGSLEINNISTQCVETLLN